MEKSVITLADAVVVVSDGMKAEYEAMGSKRVQVISNGFDTSDTSELNPVMDEKFSISHIGTLNAARNPRTLWKVLQSLCDEDDQFRADLEIQLVGKVDYSVLEDIHNSGLNTNLKKIDYLSHSEAIQRQQSSQLLLLLINNSGNAKGILTGKFYEYLAAHRPILAVGPTDGDASKVLSATGAGKIVDFDDERSTKEAVLEYYKLYKSAELKLKASSVEQYSRRSLTGELAVLLNTL